MYLLYYRINSGFVLICLKLVSSQPLPSPHPSEQGPRQTEGAVCPDHTDLWPVFSFSSPVIHRRLPFRCPLPSFSGVFCQ